MNEIKMPFFFALVLLSITIIVKSYLGYIYTQSLGLMNNELIKIFSAIGIVVGSFFVFLYFIFTSFLTCATANVLNINSNSEIKYTELISHWFIAFFPMLLLGIVSIFFVGSPSFPNQLFLLNTSVELIYVIWGILVLILQFKVNTFKSIFSVLGPLFLFYCVKTIFL